jgi:archaellum biogenesis ATPase FlaH
MMDFLKTNIEGFDCKIGGLFLGRLNLICGSSGSGKTLLSSEVISNVDVDVKHYLIEDKEPKYVKMSKENYSFACVGSTSKALELADTQIMNGFSGLIVIDDFDWDNKKANSDLSIILKAARGKDITFLVTIRKKETVDSGFKLLYMMAMMADLIVDVKLLGSGEEKKMQIKNIKDRSKNVNSEIVFDISYNGSLSLSKPSN